MRSLNWVWVSAENTWSPEGSRLPVLRISRPFFMQSLAAARSISPRIGNEPFFRLKATWTSFEIIIDASSSCAAAFSGSFSFGK